MRHQQAGEHVKAGSTTVIFFCLLAYAYLNARASDDTVESAAVKQAVSDFVSSLSVSERAEFLRASRKDLSLFHFGAGARIRDRYFRIKENSAVRRAFCGPDPNAYCDIDEASNAMVEKAWEQIHDAGNSKGP